jgi:hypothetical protein
MSLRFYPLPRHCLYIFQNPPALSRYHPIFLFLLVLYAAFFFNFSFFDITLSFFHLLESIPYWRMSRDLEGPMIILISPLSSFVTFRWIFSAIPPAILIIPDDSGSLLSWSSSLDDGLTLFYFSTSKSRPQRTHNKYPSVFGSGIVL